MVGEKFSRLLFSPAGYNIHEMLSSDFRFFPGDMAVVGSASFDYVAAPAMITVIVPMLGTVGSFMSINVTHHSMLMGRKWQVRIA